MLENRINLFTESVGSLDPILGEIETEFEKLVMTQLDRFDDEFGELDGDLDRRMREAREKEKILADFVLDRASFRKDRVNELLGESPLASHKDLAGFIEDALTYYGGSLMPHIEGGHTVNLSPKLATRLRTSASVHRGVFEPLEALAHEDPDFFAMGHDLVDAIVELPDRAELEPAVTSVRAVPGLAGPPLVEFWYEVKGDAQARFGTVIRHLVDEVGTVQSDTVTSVPDLVRHRMHRFRFGRLPRLPPAETITGASSMQRGRRSSTISRSANSGRAGEPSAFSAIAGLGSTTGLPQKRPGLTTWSTVVRIGSAVCCRLDAERWRRIGSDWRIWSPRSTRSLRTSLAVRPSCRARCGRGGVVVPA